MTPHPFEPYAYPEGMTDLAYHLHYEHGLPIADAWQHVYNGDAIRIHQGAHS